MNPLTLIRERKESTPLIQIVCGPLTAEATLSRSPIFFDQQTYTPEPAINVKLPKQGFALEEESCVVTLPLERGVHPQIEAIAKLLAQPRCAPKTTIRIRTLLKSSEDEMMVVHLYSGVLDKTRRNPSGRKAVIDLEFLTELHGGLEDIALGRRADVECDHIYTKVGCYADNSQFFTTGDAPYFGKQRRAWVTATFSTYRNSRQLALHIDSASMPGVTDFAIYNQPPGWWLRSYLEADGVRIPVQEWEDGTVNFVLNRVPPLSWEAPGKRLLLVVGCAQTPQACADRQNSERFGGLGFGIPAYNPTIEVRDS